MAAYNLIATTTVGSGGASTIVFSSIPQTFTDLKVVFSGRRSNAAGSFYVSFNGVTTNLSSRRLEGSGSGAASATDGSFIFAYGINASSYTASVFGNAEIYVPNYTGSTYKSVSIDSVTENNATEAYSTLVAGLWSNTAAITSLTISLSSGSIDQYSSASLYGIKNS
jgi:hypothetical protein